MAHEWKLKLINNLLVRRTATIFPFLKSSFFIKSPPSKIVNLFKKTPNLDHFSFLKIVIFHQVAPIKNWKYIQKTPTPFKNIDWSKKAEPRLFFLRGNRDFSSSRPHQKLKINVKNAEPRPFFLLGNREFSSGRPQCVASKIKKLIQII